MQATVNSVMKYKTKYGGRWKKWKIKNVHLVTCSLYTVKILEFCFAYMLTVVYIEVGFNGSVHLISANESSLAHWKGKWVCTQGKIGHKCVKIFETEATS